MSTIVEIMRRHPKFIGPKTSIVGAAKTMRAARIGSLFVKRGRQLVGILTDTDIVRRAIATGKPLGKVTVEKIMTTPLCTIERDRSVDDAQDMMGELGVRHLGVTQGGEIIGIVSVRDLLLHYKRCSEPRISSKVKYLERNVVQD